MHLNTSTQRGGEFSHAMELCLLKIEKYFLYAKFSIIEIPASLKILKEKNVGDVKALLLSNEN